MGYTTAMPTSRETGLFEAKRADGKIMTVHIFTEYTVTQSGGGTEEVPGTKRLQTEDGEAVKRLGKGRYRIVVTGEMLTSDDPAAL